MLAPRTRCVRTYSAMQGLWHVPAAARANGIQVLLGIWIAATPAFAQSAHIEGGVRDETGGVLPGVTVELRSPAQPQLMTVTDNQGTYRFDRLLSGRYTATFSLINFASARRDGLQENVEPLPGQGEARPAETTQPSRRTETLR